MTDDRLRVWIEDRGWWPVYRLRSMRCSFPRCQRWAVVGMHRRRTWRGRSQLVEMYYCRAHSFGRIVIGRKVWIAVAHDAPLVETGYKEGPYER